MTVEQAVEFFEHQPKIVRKIKTLNDVGLGYITLGQHATTLSGGEAQRVKLATELSKKDTGKNLLCTRRTYNWIAFSRYSTPTRCAQYFWSKRAILL